VFHRLLIKYIWGMKTEKHGGPSCLYNSIALYIQISVYTEYTVLHIVKRRQCNTYNGEGTNNFSFLLCVLLLL